MHSPLQALLREFVADSGGEGGPLSASSAESAGRPSSDGPPQKQDGGGGAEGGCRASGAIYELLTSANSFWKVGQDRLGYLPGRDLTAALHVAGVGRVPAVCASPAGMCPFLYVSVFFPLASALPCLLASHCTDTDTDRHGS